MPVKHIFYRDESEEVEKSEKLDGISKKDQYEDGIGEFKVYVNEPQPDSLGEDKLYYHFLSLNKTPEGVVLKITKEKTGESSYISPYVSVGSWADVTKYKNPSFPGVTIEYVERFRRNSEIFFTDDKEPDNVVLRYSREDGLKIGSESKLVESKPLMKMFEFLLNDVFDPEAKPPPITKEELDEIETEYKLINVAKEAYDLGCKVNG